jgi:hypothetical protein
MPGILPVIMLHGLTSFGLPLASGRIVVLTAGAAVAAFGVASSRANRDAVAAMRSSSFLALAPQAAGLIRVCVEDLAPLLGLRRAEVAHWVVDGVPRRHHQAGTDRTAPD